MHVGECSSVSCNETWAGQKWIPLSFRAAGEEDGESFRGENRCLWLGSVCEEKAGAVL